MNISKHAVQRFQQRGFQSSHIELILKYGTIKQMPGDCLEFRIMKKDIKSIPEADNFVQDIDKCQKKAILVKSNLNTIITMYNCWK